MNFHYHLLQTSSFITHILKILLTGLYTPVMFLQSIMHTVGSTLPGVQTHPLAYIPPTPISPPHLHPKAQTPEHDLAKALKVRLWL